MNPSLRILVVDDSDANRLLLCRFIANLGHRSITAENGQEAVDACRQMLPDLVLMDVLMPVKDGYQAAAEIRALNAQTWLPIIFLSARDSETEQLEGLELGDDYLTKPVSLKMLGAKIKVMVRIAGMQRQLANTAKRLAAYQEENEEEQGLTRHILDRIIGFSDCTTGPVKRWISPARNLSGDVIVHEVCPTGTFNLMIGDSTGHGLAAAICALPAVELFYTMTRAGHSLGGIADAINHKLHEILPVGRFLAAALVRIDGKRSSVEVWNGGSPAPLLVAPNGSVIAQWPSRNPPLGVLADGEFDRATEKHHLDGGACEIVVFSDGLIEAENEEGEQFGTPRLLDALATGFTGQQFESVIKAVSAHLGGGDSHDDIALASVSCTQVNNLPSGSPPKRQPELPELRAGNWTLCLHFSDSDLRRQDNAEVVAAWLRQINLKEVQFSELRLILTELYNNALDHGVLGLDSQLRNSLEGIESYQLERRARLTLLEGGFVEVRIEHLLANGRSCLRLSVKDSGAGFNASMAVPEGPVAHGYGIPLVRALASEFHYESDGSEAVVEYLL